LVSAAARRHITAAPKLSVDEEQYNIFRLGFEFDETEDQLRAINEVEQDLASPHPTERLVSGDAGFGKTEVAMRATFLMALSGFQVALLVPSSILALQHYKVFKGRFRDFPLRVELLSRTVSNAKRRQIKQELKTGAVDIVIGTHALLAKDIAFQRLGLAIVDEEHHFGVRQKEKLKNLAAEVHFLSLSATPIPRTLHMAFSGIKSHSSITTPPPLRSAVKTIIMSLTDPMVLVPPLERELARGGNVFCIAPRVADLEPIREQISSLNLPNARLGMLHGKSPDLEKTMADFIASKINILISTGIVESGLDIPNANTLIVFNSQNFGLAQLYQLRGRVGRSNRQAWAYFTYGDSKSLSEDAVKRLAAIKSLDRLGAGLDLASYDLEIRGAGNLLGKEQSGRIREIGVELYQHMLKEAITKLDAKLAHKPSPAPMPLLKISNVTMAIPPDYVAEEGLRLKLYKRLSNVSSPRELEEFKAEMVDRFGKLPQSVTNLLGSASLKLQLATMGVKELEADTTRIEITFHNKAFKKILPLINKLNEYQPYFKEHTLILRGKFPNPVTSTNDIIQTLKNNNAA